MSGCMQALDPEQREAERPAQLAEAMRRLPGPPYYNVLRWIH